MNENNTKKPHENQDKEVDYDLKAEIKSLGINQKEFAEMIDMHINAVSQWVRGINETPQWVKLLIFYYRRSLVLDKLEEKFNAVKPKGVWVNTPPKKSHTK
jgi:transcriptional regulator with XRE-family HTH domain